MVRISFRDRASEKKAIGFLLGRFSGQIKKGGAHLVSADALEALASQNIPFNVNGKAKGSKRAAVPKELSGVLSANPVAKSAFQSMPPSHQREYIKHIMEAKQPETRVRRAEKAAERMISSSSKT